jgi:hypothetical protein
MVAPGSGAREGRPLSRLPHQADEQKAPRAPLTSTIARTMRTTTTIACTLFAVLGASQAPAQSARARTWGFVGSIDVITSQYEHGSSAAGVGSRGWGLGLNAAATAGGILMGGVDVGFAGVGDDSSFTNSTTGGTKESSTSTYFASAYAGLKTPIFALNAARTRRAVLGATVGYSSWSGGRSIANCVNCDEEDVQIRGGTYVEPFVIIGGSNPNVLAGLRLGYRAYVSPDATVKNVIFVGIAGVGGR